MAGDARQGGFVELPHGHGAGGRLPSPLHRRPEGRLPVAVVAVKRGFVSDPVDLEPLVIADPNPFPCPVWPPAPPADLVPWRGDHFDPLHNARSPGRRTAANESPGPGSPSRSWRRRRGVEGGGGRSGRRWATSGWSIEASTASSPRTVAPAGRRASGAGAAASTTEGRGNPPPPDPIAILVAGEIVGWIPGRRCSRIRPSRIRVRAAL